MIIHSFQRNEIITIAFAIALLVSCTIIPSRGEMLTQVKGRPVPHGVPEETSLFVAISDRGYVLYSSRLLQLGQFDSTGKSMSHQDLTGNCALNAMFSPNGKYWIATSGDDAELRDGATGRIKASVKAKGGRIAAMNIGEKSDCFVLVSEKSVESYLSADCSLLTSFDSDATRASISPDASFIIAVNKTGRVEKEIVKTGKIERTAMLKIKDDLPGIAYVIISPDGKRAYIGTYDCKVWSLNTSDLSTAYTIDVEASVSCLKCSHDGQLLAIGTEHPDFSIVNAKGNRVFPRQDTIPSVPASFAFSSDSTTLAMGFWNGECGVYSAKDGTKKWTASVKR